MDSFIQSTPLVKPKLFRFGKTAFKLDGELLHCNPIAEFVFHFDAQPKCFGIGHFAVVESPQVKLGFYQVITAEQKLEPG